MQSLLQIQNGLEFRYVKCISSGVRLPPLETGNAVIACMHNSNASVFGQLGVLLACTLGYLSVVCATRYFLRGGRASFATSKWFVRFVAFHNGALALASLVMHVWALYAGFTSPSYNTVCKWSDSGTKSKFQLLYYVFLMSKIWEYIDTLILVFRGRPLSLLHVWHHSSVAWEVRSWLEHDFPLGVWGMVFNSGIHVLMYTYYACAVLKVRFPLKRYITMIQIVQFITSFCSLIPYYYYDRLIPGGCDGKPALLVSAFCNASFLFLFIQFYMKTYKRNKSK